MIASVYIKNGNIVFYNEDSQFSGLDGLAYELGKPLLDFVWYEHDRFQESFSLLASAFDNELAHIGAKESAFISALRENAAEVQKQEIYVYFYYQMFYEFIYAFIESPKRAVLALENKIPGAKEKLAWALDFEWPESKNKNVRVAVCVDKDIRLFRAAMDTAEVMYNHLCALQEFIVFEIEVLLHFKEKIEVPPDRPVDYIDILDEYHDINGLERFYLEQPFSTFYGRTADSAVEQLYGIDSIEDLFRFEFIKMIENDIFIKKCKNCERFFIPRRRADTEYCDRIFGETGRKCSEVGATLRYERKVAENPILDAHKKAYRRFNSRVRVKKMTQAEFMAWSEEAARKRDDCLAGNLPFKDFAEWLEQGRLRKGRRENKDAKAGGKD